MTQEQHVILDAHRHSKPLIQTLTRLISLSVLVSGLLACGNSAEVETILVNDGQEQEIYSGPTPITSEVEDFKAEFWDQLSPQDRCGSCHTNGGNASDFAFVDLDNVNTAFSEAISTNNQGQLIVDRSDPANSRVVTRVAEGHNCWVDSAAVCATIIESYINNWVGGTDSSSGRTIELSAPVLVDPGDSRNFPETAQANDPNSFELTVYPLLTAHCADCHSDTSATPQSPFFASADVDSAFEAAKSKIDLDTPVNSRFISRLVELHNCWTDCSSDADDMLTAIEQFAGGIALTEIDPALVTSKAMTLSTAILASGGSRYEDDQIALWEFKTGAGSMAFDTSGVEPAMDLDFTGPVDWVLGYGIDIAEGSKAQASTTSSKKLADMIRLTNSYSIEAWVIPANVTQENARIISYSAGDTARNFSMSQTLYNYEFMNRSSNTDAEARPSLMTNDDDEDLQASLQHVVMTFSPVAGQKIYVNGVYTDDADMNNAVNGSLFDWNENYAFVLGSEVDGSNAWSGKLRMVAIHNAALTQDQITQNYELGVGQKYVMLFSVAEQLTISDTYVMLEVEQFDNTAYLFNQPRFISLQDGYSPAADIPVEGIRIGVNGREADSGQVFGHVNTTVNATDYTPDGQILSTLGTVIALEKGPEADEFFLTFERLGGQTNVRVEAEPIIPVPAADPEAASDIGVKTFEEINATMSLATNIPVTNSAVSSTYTTYQQQLPAIENISAFLSSHQMAVAQLAMSYCNEAVNADKVLASNDPDRLFAGFNFNATAGSAFDNASQNQIIEPLLEKLSNLDTVTPANNLSNTQPDDATIKAALGDANTQDLDDVLTGDAYESLVTTMTQCLPGCDTTNRTEEIAKAMCAATLGSALTLIQ